MHGLSISNTDAIRHVLAIGAHADDIEIGCGATVLALTRTLPELQVTWVVLSASGARAREAEESAARFLQATKGQTVEVHGFEDGYLPYVGGDVKRVFEDLKKRVDPGLILTHARDDLHQDHRLVCELTWNTWRDHWIFEYEVPKYDGDLGHPNVFVPVAEELALEKSRLLGEMFPSQSAKHWFDEKLFLALMRIRGMESASASGYAEAFTCRKLSVSVG